MEEPAAVAAGAATEHSQDDSAPEMESQNFSEHEYMPATKNGT